MLQSYIVAGPAVTLVNARPIAAIVGFEEELMLVTLAFAFRVPPYLPDDIAGPLSDRCKRPDTW